MFNKSQRSTFPYWFAHWCAFQMTALNLNAWKFKYLFHDIEKPFLKLFLPYEKVQMLHRTYHNHHPEWLENHLRAYIYKLIENRISVNKFLKKFNFEEMVIDWECGHFTKSQATLNARDEFEKLTNCYNFENKYPLITRFCKHEFLDKTTYIINKFNL